MSQRQHWADVIRIGAVLLIFLFHFGPAWTATQGNTSSGVWLFVQDHFATWGIAALVALSGFALTLSLGGIGGDSVSRTPYREYLAKRLGRLLGPFWLVAILFSIAGFALGEQGWHNLWKLPLWMLGLGVVHPSIYQPISEAWWYVTLALQISLIVPLLLATARKIGLLPLTVVAAGLCAGLLAVIKFLIPSWDYLSQGLVLCRLVEVTAGIAAAELMLSKGQVSRDSRRAFTGSACLVIAACVSPFLTMLDARASWQATVVLVGLFALGALVFGPLTPVRERVRWLTWAATISYCFYLTHAPISKYSGRLLRMMGMDSTLIAIPVMLVICAFVAWLFDKVATRWIVPGVFALSRRALRVNAGKRP